MPRTPAEEAEYQMLLKEMEAQPTAVPTRTPAEEQELQSLRRELQADAYVSPSQMTAYSTHDPITAMSGGSRAVEGLETAGEFTGLPALIRLYKDATGEHVPEYDVQDAGPTIDPTTGKPKPSLQINPRVADLLGVAMTVAGGSGAKALGKLGPFIKAMTMSAGGAGVGQAIAGDASRELAAKVESPLAKTAIQMAPSALGALAGPAGVRTAGLGARTAYKSAGGLAEGLPMREALQQALPTAQQARGLVFNTPTEAGVHENKMGGAYVDPRMQESLLGLRKEGVEMTPAQAQAYAGSKVLGGKAPSTPESRFEYRSAGSPEAVRFAENQGRGAKAAVARRMEEGVAGSTQPSAKVGGELVSNVEGNLVKAETALDSVEQGLHEHAYMKRPDNNYKKAYASAFENMRKNTKLFGKGKGDTSLTDSAVRTMNKIVKLSQGVKNGSGAIRFMHRAVQEMDEAFKAGGGLDSGAQAEMYGYLRDATIKTIGRNKSLAGEAKKLDQALTRYADTHFNQSGKAAQSLAGVTPKGVRVGDVSTASSEHIGKKFLDPYHAKRLRASVEGGSIGREEASKATLSYILDAAKAGDDSIKPERFAAIWKTVPSDTKAWLPPKLVEQLDALVEPYSFMGEGTNRKMLADGNASAGAVRAGVGPTGANIMSAMSGLSDVMKRKTGYYGGTRGFYMPSAEPRGGVTAKAFDRASQVGAIGSRSAFTEQDQLEKAKKRAKDFMMLNDIRRDK